jgi:NTE family protein
MTESDGLALPIDFSANYGAGHRRAVVLGGGGIFFIAWQVAYLRELQRRDVDLGQATVVVGTSAGSVVASLLAADRVGLAEKELAIMARLPAVIAAMAPSGNLTPSQDRAVTLFRQATDSQPDTIRGIGYAALAADAVPAAKLHRSVASMLAQRSWPAQSLMITTVDTYTGERLVVRANSGVPVSRAAAASSSVPGLFSPQPILDRRCMDGGVSGSGTHADLAVGAERVVILSLGAENPAREAMMTIRPNSLPTEAAAVRKAGGEVFVRGPLETNIDTLMSPTSVPAAVAMGQSQAAGDADALRAFWT